MTSNRVITAAFDWSWERFAPFLFFSFAKNYMCITKYYTRFEEGNEMKNNIMESIAVLSALLFVVSVAMFVYFAITSLNPTPIMLSAAAAIWYWILFEFSSRRIK